jgi:hypothetical protein
MPHKAISLFVLGRLCLFGEHSDWAGLHRIINANIVPGAAIVTGIEQGIYALLRNRTAIFLTLNGSYPIY